MDHPRLIPGSERVIDFTPSGSPLYRWEERYPDGTVRTFEEFWASVTGASGTTYGLSLVRCVP